jgi:hypothetical protein
VFLGLLGHLDLVHLEQSVSQCSFSTINS